MYIANRNCLPIPVQLGVASNSKVKVLYRPGHTSLWKDIMITKMPIISTALLVVLRVIGVSKFFIYNFFFIFFLSENTNKFKQTKKFKHLWFGPKGLSNVAKVCSGQGNFFSI